MSIIRKHWQFLAVAAVVLVLTAGWYADRTTNETDPAELAASIGADYCTNTGYYKESKLDGAKATIFDCMKDGEFICVTEEDGIARDSTASVTALFVDTFETDKPTCVS